MTTSQRNLKILHLEDLATDADLVARELRKGGIQFDSVVVDNKTDFIRVLTEFSPDLILSDHDMPSFSSLDALRILKGLQINIPFILVTAMTSEEIAVNVMKEGAWDYVLKDRMQRLPSAITQAFEKFTSLQSQRKAEEKLSQERFLLRLIIDNLPEAITVKDINLRYLIANSLAVQYLGAPSEKEIFGKVLFDFVAPPLAVSIQDVDRLVIQSGKAIIKQEMEVRTPDGENRWMLISKLPLKVNNEVLGVVEVGYDITDQKNNQLHLQKLNESLEAHARELADSNAELEHFAFVASHDLQEPLRMVTSFLQLLKIKYSAQLDATALEYIGFAVDGSERMKRLIQDLLEYSGIGTATLVHENVNVREAINDVLAMMESIILEKQAIVKIDALPDSIGTQKSMITQLFQNLISNALKYSGGKVLEITISGEDKGAQWLFSVRDNGIGIDPKYFDKIFVIFQRLHTKSKYAGTGVGLAICKKIVERHGGRIWVESKPGEGSVFYFTLKK